MCLMKGRTSSLRLNGAVCHCNALVAAGFLQPVLAYVRTALDPADRPSRYASTRNNKHGEPLKRLVESKDAAWPGSEHCFIIGACSGTASCRSSKQTPLNATNKPCVGCFFASLWDRSLCPNQNGKWTLKLEPSLIWLGRKASLAIWWATCLAGCRTSFLPSVASSEAAGGCTMLGGVRNFPVGRHHSRH